jgi:D-alanyl-D-alanine carboxypeptidase
LFNRKSLASKHVRYAFGLFYPIQFRGESAHLDFSTILAATISVARRDRDHSSISLGQILRAEDNLAKRVEEHLALPHFKTAHWGMQFVDLKSGEVVLERNSEKLFVPASTTKLFSTAAALDALGADHRFRTPIHRRGNGRCSGQSRRRLDSRGSAAI